jgi:hypothetical protein
MQGFAKDRLLDSQATDLIRQVYENALASLETAGQAVGDESDWARETLALRIIELAGRGERDPVRLREGAIARLAVENPTRQ